MCFFDYASNRVTDERGRIGVSRKGRVPTFCSSLQPLTKQDLRKQTAVNSETIDAGR